LDVPGNDAPVQLLFVGKLEIRKGFDLFAAALERLDPANNPRLLVSVAGDGPLRARIPELLAAGVTVQWLGHLSRDSLWQRYRTADVVVVPSRHDPWVNVINESMSMGTPVLASVQCGGAALAQAAGWCFDACCPTSLDSELRAAITECRSPLRRARAVNAESDYRPGAAADRMLAVIRDVLS
jgi:glycosyltransferase involved in cell wall biosynthesis